MYQNKVTLIGFLGNDAEIRTANDLSFTMFSLATRSSYKDKNSNQYISHTECHRCVDFGKLSEFAKMLTKGAHVHVEGELLSRSHIQGLASYTTLNGVSVARRNRVNPAAVTTSRMRASPACAPRHNPTSCEREQGVQSRVENEK